jgi:hypothetical protein
MMFSIGKASDFSYGGGCHVIPVFIARVFRKNEGKRTQQGHSRRERVGLDAPTSG